MRVPGEKKVRDVLAADLEHPLIFDPGRCTRSGREEQRISLSERNGCKPSAQLLSVCVQRGEVLFIKDVASAGGHDSVRPASLDAFTLVRVNLLEGNGHLIGSEEFPNCGHRLVEEDRPRSASGQGKEIFAQIDLHKLGSCVLELT